MIKRSLGIALLAVGLLTSSVVAKELRIGTNPAYPPFEFKGKDNELLGFDIDIMDELCKIMEQKCVYSEQTFDALIPNLRLRRFDAIISSMDITEERQKQVAFTEPYYQNYSIYITTKANEEKINADTLGDQKIGVLAGSTHQQYIRQQFPKGDISSYPQYPSAINDLLIGRVNVVFGDGEAVYNYVKENDSLTTIGEKVTDPKYFGQGLAIGVGVRDKALLKEFNEALEVLKASDRYQEIYDKWFTK